ncbi:hypothetical protein E3N88_40199 [Mikania micrantha]|uniref:Uncharacterized protein n=1 Tax=Mikania micrantha TaxID=192012 RepID=A0A5N6LLX0_9ASTR|nr:hypothetical protein E3N88_40199 [Mikania micrantha]
MPSLHTKVYYFRFPHDFKMLPGFEVDQLARLKMLYCEDSGMSSWFARQIQFECRKRWVNFKPQQPERYYQPKIDANTRRHKVILKWLPPNVMKKIPLRKMRQDFSDIFRWWYYEGRTAEAVIVLCKENTWDTIHVRFSLRLEIWITLQFMRVIRLCFAFDIHAGSEWKALSEKFLKTGADK